MADRIVAVGLTANTASYVAGMNKASAAAAKTAGATEKIGSSVDKTHKSLLTMKNIMLYTFGYGAATIATKALGAVVGSMMDFEQAIANLGSASMATAGDMEAMRDAALKAGQDTQFTATQAADAMTELAKAGVSTSDILGGALAGALDLAAAGQVDVAFAAETAATAMVQFGISGSDMSHVADLLAAGAGKAQGGVEELALALRQGGQVAAMVGWDFENTTTALTAFAAAGLLGSDAGTSLKTMLLRLARPSNQAAEVMQRYGLSVYDASGNMVGASELAGRLTSAFADLDPQARNAAMGIIFGTDAVRAANVLYAEGEAGIREWGVKVNDAGYAAEQAARKTDTLRGDLNRLQGTVDALINDNASGLNTLLRTLTQVVDQLVRGGPEINFGPFVGIQKGAEDAALSIAELERQGKEFSFSPAMQIGPEKPDDVSLWDVLLGRTGGGAATEDDFTRAVSQTEVLLGIAGDAAKNAALESLEYGESMRFLNRANVDAQPAASGAAEAIDGIADAASDAEDEIESLKEAIQGMGQNSIDTSRAHDQLTDAIKDAKQPLQDVKDAQQELADATDEASREAARQKVAAAKAALSLKGNSDAALTNKENLRKLAEQGKETASAFIDGTAKGADKARREMWRARDAFIETAVQLGVNEKKAVRMAEKYGLIPGNIPTHVQLFGAEGAIAQAGRVQAALQNIKDRYVKVFVSEVRRDAAAASRGSNQPGGGYRGGWASDIAGYTGGGFVYGPGSSTSDSVLARLSRGEFVVNARAASDYGPLLDAINKGAKLAPRGGDTIIVNATTESIVREIESRQRVRSQLRRRAA